MRSGGIGAGAGAVWAGAGAGEILAGAGAVEIRAGPGAGSIWAGPGPGAIWAGGRSLGRAVSPSVLPERSPSNSSWSCVCRLGCIIVVLRMSLSAASMMVCASSLGQPILERETRVELVSISGYVTVDLVSSCL